MGLVRCAIRSPRRGPEEAKLVCVEGSGAVEKHMDLVSPSAETLKARGCAGLGPVRIGY